MLRLTLGLTHLPSLWALGLKQPGLAADQFPMYHHGMLRRALLFAVILEGKDCLKHQKIWQLEVSVFGFLCIFSCVSNICAGMSFGIRSSRGIAKSRSKRNRSKCSGSGRSIQLRQHGLVSHHSGLCAVKLEGA